MAFLISRVIAVLHVTYERLLSSVIQLMPLEVAFLISRVIAVLHVTYERLLSCVNHLMLLLSRTVIGTVSHRLFTPGYLQKIPNEF